MTVKRKLLVAAMVVVFFVGLGIYLYPTANGKRTQAELRQEAESFIGTLSTVPVYTEPDVPPAVIPESVPPESILPEITQPEPVYPELRSAMEQYNRQLWEERQAGLCNKNSYTKPSFKLQDYGAQSEVFGVLSIPKLDLYMPLYLGATEQHLADGCAQLSQTSIPIGGVNTNAVISGHRGYNGAPYFRYITELIPGDEVIITNFWGELRYKVTEIKIIEPHEVKEVLIQEGKDMITLLTCHPYASGGRQRYLVFCQRTG